MVKHLYTTAMGKHPQSIKNDMPIKKRDAFRDALNRILTDIDQDTSWSSEKFTPLDAKVSVRTKLRTHKKLTDLLNALKTNQKARSFLVLGEPGSGKSVALRELCRDLLKEVPNTNKIPIYVNLKEWHIRIDQNSNTNSITKDLTAFIKRYLWSRGTTHLQQIIDDYFDTLVENGRIFFILDSFDEIPVVMDAEESSKIIDEISYAIDMFISGGAHYSRGVLSSRYFRQPSSRFNAEIILEIQPFTDEKIRQNIRLNSNPEQAEEIIHRIFKDNPYRVSELKNPFNHEMLLQYLKENDNFPENRSQIYESFINKRIQKVSEQLDRFNLSKEELLNASIEIAYFMYQTSDSGLEIKVDDLREYAGIKKNDAVLRALKHAVIGRLSDEMEPRFSFVHRRFAEYFLSQKILKDNIGTHNLESIKSDTRWWDALVLYCETAPDNKALEIANFCWQELSKIANSKLAPWQKIVELDKEYSELALKTKSLKDFHFDPLFFGFHRVWKKLSNFLFNLQISGFLNRYMPVLDRMVVYDNYIKVTIEDCSEKIAKNINDYKSTLARLDMSKLKNKDKIEIVNLLRFLYNAFNSRIELLTRYHAKLADFLEFLYIQPLDPMLKKIAVEAVCIAPRPRINNLLFRILNSKSVLIIETAFKAVRHLSFIDRENIERFSSHFMKFRRRELFRHRKNLFFSLRISGKFEELRRNLRNKLYDMYGFLFGWVLFLLICLFYYEIVIIYLSTLSIIVLFVSMFGALVSFRQIAEGKSDIYKVWEFAFRIIISLWTIIMFSYYINLWLQVDLFPSTNFISFQLLLLCASILFLPKRWLLNLSDNFLHRLKGNHNQSVTESHNRQKPSLSEDSNKKKAERKINSMRDAIQYLIFLFMPLTLFTLMVLSGYAITSILGFEGATTNDGSATTFKLFGVSIDIIIMFFMLIAISIVIFAPLIHLSLKKLFYAKHSYYARRYVRSSKFNNRMSRQEIASGIASAHALGFEFEYIRELKNRRIVAYGEWPDSSFPTLGATQSEDLLIQLEEDWLKLNQ